MPVELIQLLVLVILLVEIALLFYELLNLGEFITPTYIYENTKLNKPTCWVLFILFLLTAWLNNIFKICALTVNFFYWITHVGREEDEQNEN